MVRSALWAFIGAVALATSAHAQPANPLPSGVMTIVVPLAAGGPADSAARMYANKLSPLIDRTVVVENRPGAGGNIGAAYVANAKPDGMTWLYTIDTVLTVNPHIYASQGFDPETAFTPAGRLGHNLLILAVNAKNVPAKSFRELLALSKDKPLNFGSAGLGSPGHVAFEYLRMQSGINANHVPYRGANPAMTDLIAGNIEAAFITAGALLPQIEKGYLRGLATSADVRVPSLPDIPTADEAGIKGIEMRVGNYLLAPAGTDSSIVEFMTRHMETIMDMPDVRKLMLALSIEPIFAPPKEAQARLVTDHEHWGKVAKTMGMKSK